jgi:hypothetical protein
MKLKEVLDGKFQTTMRDLTSQKLPIKTAFILAKATEKLETEINLFNKVKADSINKYAQKDSDGKLIAGDDGNVKLSPEDIVTIEAQLTEMVEAEISLPTVTISDLGDKVTMSVTDVLNLKGLITD